MSEIRRGDLIIFFVFVYFNFQVRTSRNTFQVGEHGVSNFSIIILNVLNVSLNVLNVSLNVFCMLPCLLSRISPVSRNFNFLAVVDCQTCQSSSQLTQLLLHYLTLKNFPIEIIKNTQANFLIRVQQYHTKSSQNLSPTSSSSILSLVSASK